MSAYGKIVRPTERFGGIYTLDMRVTSKQHQELADIINESVDHTQKFLVTEVPSILIVTEKQFASLNNFTEEMLTVRDRFFQTKSGYVMEVEIDEELVDVHDEVHETIKDTEELEDLIEEEQERRDNDQKSNDILLG